MMASVRTQNKYSTQMDEIFELELGSNPTAEDALACVGMNFQIMDDGALLEYQVVCIFRGVDDDKYYAICRELIQPNNI